MGSLPDVERLPHRLQRRAPDGSRDIHSPRTRRVEHDVGDENAVGPRLVALYGAVVMGVCVGLRELGSGGVDLRSEDGLVAAQCEEAETDLGVRDRGILFLVNDAHDKPVVADREV